MDHTKAININANTIFNNNIICRLVLSLRSDSQCQCPRLWFESTTTLWTGPLPTRQSSVRRRTPSTGSQKVRAELCVCVVFIPSYMSVMLTPMHPAGAVTEVKNQVKKEPSLPLPSPPLPLPSPQLANAVVLVGVILLLRYCVTSKNQD